MNALLLIVFGLAGLALIALLFIILAMVLASQNKYFTSIEKGKVVFVTRGDDLKDIWPNVDDHCLSQESDPRGWRWLVNNPDEKKRQKIFFVGALWGTLGLQKILW